MKAHHNTPTAVLAPVLDFLRGHAPFDQMAPAQLEFLAKRLKLGFYPKGSAVLEPGGGSPRRLYIIKQGRVRGETGQGEPQEGAWELLAGECFPLGALLARRSPYFVHRAVEDSFCFELERADFEQLLQQSPVFHDFCTRRLANLLDQALRDVQARSASEFTDDTSFSAPLSALVRRAPVTCERQEPIRRALELMNRERVGSIIVTDEQRGPIGIFTLHDVLTRVTLPSARLERPISEVMTPGPVSLPPNAFAYEAALVMARRGFGHVCVVDGATLVGVVSERDLFSLQRVGLANLSRSIGLAADIDALARLGGEIHRLVHQMLALGVSVEQLTQIITALNDHVSRRVIELCLADTPPAFAFSWLSFGSEGRQEQTLKTDQDNGILFVPPAGVSADQVRTELLPLARRINEALAICGYPLCTGNIMAGNPECCLSLEEWKQRFRRWIAQGSPKNLLAATIFFDFRGLWGAEEPIEELRRWVGELIAGNRLFLRHMAANALNNRPPLGLVREFVVSSSGPHANMLDLKLRGTTPFVDGARIIALANRIHETNTLARLRAAVGLEVVRAEEAEAWCNAYSYVQLLRMRNHHSQERKGLPLDNHVDPDQLNELDRRILRESFRQARKLQSTIALDYQL
jgi:CBS domain-containing protein